jgi:prophage regulatory protein
MQLPSWVRVPSTLRESSSPSFEGRFLEPSMSTESRAVVSLLRLPIVRERTGLSRSAIYQGVQRGAFPAPIQLGTGRAVAWASSEIDQWIADRIRASRPQVADDCRRAA